jgi:hypothetical protein
MLEKDAESELDRTPYQLFVHHRDERRKFTKTIFSTPTPSFTPVACRAAFERSSVC